MARQSAIEAAMQKIAKEMTERAAAGETFAPTNQATLSEKNTTHAHGKGFLGRRR